MANQGLKQSLIITIENGYEATVYSSNSNSTSLNRISMYMNDKISCNVSLYNHYFDSSIEVQSDVITPLTGVTASAMIKVGNKIIKSDTTISESDTMDFIFQIPYFETDEEELVGKFQILITDSSGDKIHTPVIDISVRKPLGDISTIVDSSDRIAALLKEKTLKTFEVNAYDLSSNADGNYEVVLQHSIVSMDGNLFVSVLDEDKVDVAFQKYKVSDTAIRLEVAEREKLFVSIRK